MDSEIDKPLLQVIVTMNGVPCSAILDCAATLNFVAPSTVTKANLSTQKGTKRAVRVATGPRRATDLIATPQSMSLCGIDCGTQSYRVLPGLKAADVILGLPFLEAMNIKLDPGHRSFTIGDQEVNSDPIPRRVDAKILEPKRFAKLIGKAQRCKSKGHDAVASFFLGHISMADDGLSIKTDFGESFDAELTSLLHEFQDVSAPLDGPPISRGDLDHHIELTGVPPRQRRNRLSPAELGELKRQCIKYLKTSFI